jgi:hypothetical protein
MKSTLKILTLTLGTLTALTGYGKERIILLNEGNWEHDNGKITYFEDDHVVSNQWFRDVNGTGKKLGDTPNDIIQVNENLLAIAVNWSNIIQFIDTDGKAVAATEDVPNNRELATDGRYVYVTSFGHECLTTDGYVDFEKGFVAKIDTSTYQVVATCEVGYEPESISYYNGYLFIANTGGYAFQESHEYETTISIVDAETMTLVRDVDTEQINLCGKMSRVGQYLCVASAGDYYDVESSTVIFDCDAALRGDADADCYKVLDCTVNYTTPTRDDKIYAVGASFSYKTGKSAKYYLTIDPAAVMRGEGGVEESLPGTLVEDLKGMTKPYYIYVNPYSGYIYATDAADYASNGKLYQWNADGELLGKHETYINPSHIIAIDNEQSGMTGMIGMGQDSEDNAIYNLQGMKVTAPEPGNIYIKNRKKIIYNLNH